MIMRRMLRIGLLLAAVAVAGAPAAARAAGGGSTSGQSSCIAKHPAYVDNVLEVQYSSSCSGHDEPELNPLSNAKGSGQNVTWTLQLPSNGSFFDVNAVGPTFWFGGPVTDPTSLFGQAFEELQFYPNTVISKCDPNGGAIGKEVTGAYSICSPVWSLRTSGQKPNFHEPAAYNALVTRNGAGQALVMHQGDRVQVHYFVTSAKDGWHISVTDLNSGQSGTIVLNGASGPMMPAYNVSKIGNSLPWGIVHDAPIAFVWEIGHMSQYTSPAAAFCWPGEAGCYSYDAPAWADQKPLRIISATFNNGTVKPSGWSVVSDYGGKAEVTDPTETGSTCTSYGGPFCIYPWFTRNTDGSFSYGVNYPTTANDFNKVLQFKQQLQCGGPFGPDSTYCSRVIVP
jgi:hypothetical protein